MTIWCTFVWWNQNRPDQTFKNREPWPARKFSLTDKINFPSLQHRRILATRLRVCLFFLSFSSEHFWEAAADRGCVMKCCLRKSHANCTLTAFAQIEWRNMWCTSILVFWDKNLARSLSLQPFSFFFFYHPITFCSIRSKCFNPFFHFFLPPTMSPKTQ